MIVVITVNALKAVYVSNVVNTSSTTFVHFAAIAMLLLTYGFCLSILF